MVRGSRSIYKDIFEAREPIEKCDAERKGRSEILIKQRNTCLLYRFAYYVKVHDLKYVQALNKVSTEFFLSPRTITDLLQSETEALKQAREEVKNIKHLKTMFPFLSWEAKA